MTLVKYFDPKAREEYFKKYVLYHKESFLMSVGSKVLRYLPSFMKSIYMIIHYHMSFLTSFIKTSIFSWLNLLHRHISKDYSWRRSKDSFHLRMMGFSRRYSWELMINLIFLSIQRLVNLYRCCIHKIILCRLRVHVYFFSNP